ncbi:MAG: hypothetical protein IPO09_15185 [Anaeromyxobacter sp.]|nr:hypothetical protein [Anaeromyxobacter sp.]MBL0277062.1 hypothetical protein [Anaeromyxobacter sp.]
MDTQKLVAPTFPSTLVALGRAPTRRPAAPRPPAAGDCLRCQLGGRRRLDCLSAEACARLPLVFPLAPLLLAGWLGTALAFLLTL